MRLAAFGFGRRASRSNVGTQIPDVAGVALLILGAILWVVISVVPNVGGD